LLEAFTGGVVLSCFGLLEKALKIDGVAAAVPNVAIASYTSQLYCGGSKTFETVEKLG
jgi:hypothetical protein